MKINVKEKIEHKNEKNKSKHSINHSLSDRMSIVPDYVLKVLNEVGPIELFQIAHSIVCNLLILSRTFVKMNPYQKVLFVCFKVHFKFSISFKLFILYLGLPVLYRKNRCLISSFSVIYSYKIVIVVSFRQSQSIPHIL